jgi:hypothetical protein
MKKIEDYTADELSAKIKAIKAERERTANALKQYEEELERRKNKNWLPLGDVLYSAKYESVDLFRVEMKLETTFNDYSCFDKYREYLEAINKALVANSKGEPIDIKVLLPLLKKGWVAMEDNGVWCHYTKKPIRSNTGWETESIMDYNTIFLFNLKPAEDWKNSLMECGL